MRSGLRLKLLELTQHSSRISLDQLSRELRCEPSEVADELGQLRDLDLVSFDKKALEVTAEQRIAIADRLIHSGHEPARVSRYLDWKEFENFALQTFEENAFQVTNHFIFKTKIGRREIDVLAWNQTFIFAVDCKHWSRGLFPSRMVDAAQAQVERTSALAERPELLTKLGVSHAVGRRIIPMLLVLGQPREVLADGVPVVPISKLVSFLYEVSPIDDRFRNIRAMTSGKQLQFASVGKDGSTFGGPNA